MTPVYREMRLLLLALLSPALQRADLPPEEVDDSLNLVESGLLDSIAFLNLIATLEEKTASELDLFDVDPESLTTIGGLMELLVQAVAPPLTPGRTADG